MNKDSVSVTQCKRFAVYSSTVRESSAHSKTMCVLHQLRLEAAIVDVDKLKAGPRP
jgi:hypothetical protein